MGNWAELEAGMLQQNTNEVRGRRSNFLPEVLSSLTYSLTLCSTAKVVILFAGWTLQQTPSSHWHWCAGLGRCFHSDEIPLWKSGGPALEPANFWDHLLRCFGSQLWTCWGARTVWNIRGFSCQQRSKYQELSRVRDRSVKSKFCGCAWSLIQEEYDWNTLW